MDIRADVADFGDCGLFAANRLGLRGSKMTPIRRAQQRHDNATPDTDDPCIRCGEELGDEPAGAICRDCLHQAKCDSCCKWVDKDELTGFLDDYPACSDCIAEAER